MNRALMLSVAEVKPLAPRPPSRTMLLSETGARLLEVKRFHANGFDFDDCFAFQPAGRGAEGAITGTLAPKSGQRHAAAREISARLGSPARR